MAVAATVGAAPARNNGTADLPVVDQLVKEMRTDFIREKVKEYGELIQSHDYDKRKAAIDFFHDVRAARVILLAMRSGPFDIRDYAADALCDVACVGDAYVIEELLEALRDTTLLVSGGTPGQIAMEKYRVTVVIAMERITNVQLVEGKPLKIPDEDVPEIEKTVKKWLENKSPKGDAKSNRGTSTGAM
jgi:hypothetical protein